MRAAACFLLLAGCGGLVAEKPVATAIAVQKPVEVAVLVKCMTAADIPALPTTVFDKTEQNPEKLALAAKIDLAEYRLWVVAADAQMRRCAAQPDPQAPKP